MQDFFAVWITFIVIISVVIGIAAWELLKWLFSFISISVGWA